MLLFPNVSKLAKFSPAVNVGCVAAAAGERAAVTRSRQLAAPAHCTQLSAAAAGGGELTAAAAGGGGGGSWLQLGSGGLSTHCSAGAGTSLAPAHW